MKNFWIYPKRFNGSCEEFRVANDDILEQSAALSDYCRLVEL